ncbi:MAG TPA: penicillin-binding transpeptidase domain-containing protein [Actinomycetales bacterium]|nr:penicillin-binding transpeptidase domain-containing protein [Actinomycetales bacterium]
MLDSPRSGRRWPWVAAALAVVLVAVGAGLLLRQRSQAAQDDAARALAERYAAAMARKDVSGIPFAGSTVTARQQAFATAVQGLGSGSPTVQAGAVRRNGDSATSTLAVTWTLPGGARWAYDLPLRLTRGDSSWQVSADQPAVHPQLEDGERLRAQRTQAPRGSVFGGDGTPLVTPRAVVDVGIQPGRVKGSPATLAKEVAGIVDVQAAPLAERVQQSTADAFVDVITLRRADYDKVRARLRPLPGVVFRERQQPLAPSREFARALLGSVGPVTGEMVSQGKGRYVAGDVAGTSGLQRQYDEQLAGTAGVSVQAVSANAGAAPRTLFSVAPKAGTDLRLTLDAGVQQAADAALKGLDQPGALVAVDVRTGRVLAVANTPATGLNRAVVGRYPPGSTFKVVTTLALLQKGLQPSDPVACPPTTSVDGRSFRNYEAEAFGRVPFRTDFAKSCNTAFVGLSSRLQPDDLRNTAASVGIGREWDLGTDAFTGSVPRTTSDVDKAASSFGQGRNLVSPLAVTVATASVARGSYLPPTLVLRPGAQPASPAALPEAAVTTLRSLMRDVVTGGTGTALRSVPGGAVYAKTGTAEFGTQVPPKTRAWITGWQGDVAFTALVEEGKSGGTVAGPVAARFLKALNG